MVPSLPGRTTVMPKPELETADAMAARLAYRNPLDVASAIEARPHRHRAEGPRRVRGALSWRTPSRRSASHA